MRTLRFDVEGMSCQSCASRIEKALKRKEGVLSAYVNFAGENAAVTVDESKVSGSQIEQWIEKAGYKARPAQAAPERKAPGKLPMGLLTVWLASLPFWAGMAGMLFGTDALTPNPWVQFGLALAIQGLFALPFYKRAWSSLRDGAPNMDALVVLGTTTIFLYSAWNLFSQNGGHIYFEAAVMIFAFVSLGKFLEERTKRESLDSIGLFLDLAPKSQEALIDGEWKAVSPQAIRAGMRLRAKQGERVGADGIVSSGVAQVDESHLTGEPKLLEKKPGDELKAGSLIVDGFAEYDAKRVGMESYVGDVIRALSEAQSTQAPIARLADRVAAVFVPGVIAAALLAFAANWMVLGSFDEALVRAVSTLVIACPCALGLATPAAVMAGMGLAARNGALFKDAAALQRAAQIDRVALDKTGTLTQGKPTVAEQKTAPGFDPADILSVAGALEEGSNHPWALAIRQARDAAASDSALPPNSALRRSFRVFDVAQAPGQGIAGSVQAAPAQNAAVGPDAVSLETAAQTRRVKAGTIEHAAGDSEAARQDFERLRQDLGSELSLVAVSIDGRAAAVFSLQDQTQPDSKAAVGRLRALGLEPFILSGDGQKSVDDLARKVGIPTANALGGLTPRAKKEWVERAEQAGFKVGMAGDGVNDAPALAQASVSFAMGQGAAIARSAADVTLVKDGAMGVSEAVWISRACIANIKQNLFFAFVYNVAGIGAAALGWLNPAVAAACMAMSSVSVIGNALRLKSKKTPNSLAQIV